jgi:hypothetical protein
MLDGSGEDAIDDGASQRPSDARQPSDAGPSIYDAAGDPVGEPANEAGGGLSCAGLAAEFDGASYAVFARPVQDDFTIEGWIKTTYLVTAGTAAWDGAPFTWGDVQSPNANDFSTGVVSGYFAFTVGNPDTTVRSTTLVTSGVWTHVAATRQRSTSTLQVLVNGVVEASTQNGNTNSLTSSLSLVLGGNAVGNHFFIGRMDEVRIWNVVRTPAEIAGAMHQRLLGNEPGLVTYWRLDEGSGNTLVDTSPGNNNGTVGGSFAWVPSDAPICP